MIDAEQISKEFTPAWMPGFVDPADNVAGFRTLGTGASQAAKGNHTHLGLGPHVVFNSSGSVQSGSGIFNVSYAGAGTYTINRSIANYAADTSYGVTAFGNSPAIAYGRNFTASGAYVSRAGIPAFSSSSAFSWFIRIRHPETASVYGYFQQWVSSTNTTTARWNGGTLQVYFGSASNMFSAALGTNLGILANQWYTIGVVYDGTLTGNANRAKLYVNGEPWTYNVTYSGTIPASLAANAGTFDVGRTNSSTSPSYGPKDIATFAVWNSARTDSAMANAHAGNYALASLLWQFPSSSLTVGATMPDDSGNSLTGTMTGGTMTGGTIGAAPLIGVVTAKTTTSATIEFRDYFGRLQNPETATVAMTY